MSTDVLATLLFSHRFVDDYCSVHPDVAKRATRRIELIEQHGAFYPGLETRRVQGQRDPAYHYMDVDDAFRMVVYIQGKHVLFEKLGPHDPTLRWGERASMSDYVTRLNASVREFPELGAARRDSQPGEETEPRVVDVPDELLELLPATPASSDVLIEARPDFLEGFREGVLEDWMVFLSPLQRYIVDRESSGPMRLSGGPGTGKTVVALHRAAHLAGILGEGSTILVTSYVRTLPPILENLYRRMATELSGSKAAHIEFRHIVEIARDVVDRRNPVAARLDNDKARSLFAGAVRSLPKHADYLREHRIEEGYLWDEVGKVLLGRQVKTRDDYLTIKRHGRRRRLTQEERRVTWDVLMAYGAACSKSSPRVYDQDSLILRAADLLRSTPLSAEYDAIIVDEAQDLTAAALSMLVALLSNGGKGKLLLTGDGGQRIYPGGYRLADLGIDIRGRSFVLRDAYRSTVGILESISRLGRLLSPQDFGEAGLGDIPVRAVRMGDPPTIRGFESAAEEVARIAGRLREQAPERLDGTAILLPTNAAARDWRRRLKDLGIRSTLLEDYDGVPTPGVKVGTYSRSKGLEFLVVYLPNVSDGIFPSVPLDMTDEYVLQGSWLYIAMARARDELFVTYVGAPSYLIAEMIAPTGAQLESGDDDAEETEPGKSLLPPTPKTTNKSYTPSWDPASDWRNDK